MGQYITNKLTTREQAEQTVREAKARLPFRNWCAIRLGEEWQVHDSIRAAKRAWKRTTPTAGTELLSYGKD